MFVLHAVHTIHPGMFKPQEWEFFVGDIVPDLGQTIPRGFPDWAAAERAPMFRLLASTFPELVQSLGLEGTITDIQNPL